MGLNFADIPVIKALLGLKPKNVKGLTSKKWDTDGTDTAINTNPFTYNHALNKPIQSLQIDLYKIDTVTGKILIHGIADAAGPTSITQTDLNNIMIDHGYNPVTEAASNGHTYVKITEKF